MAKNLIILGILGLIVALPFIFRKPAEQGEWREGDPVIVIVSPHNEAIRYEFARGFSRWHKKKYGQPVKVDWRNIGGTTEIGRYLASEYTAGTRAWWMAQGKEWPGLATDDLTRPAPTHDSTRAVHQAFRETDSPDAISCGIDLFFGGGEFDHSNAYRAGFTVKVSHLLPQNLFNENGVELVPQQVSGEVWRTDSVIGNVVSTFGIIYNIDRLNDLNITNPPSRWADLADFRYYGQVGLADPTKSGSIAKAFEMIVHQQMHEAARNAGFTDPEIAANEQRISQFIKQAGKNYQRGDVPSDLAAYQTALEKGFENGLILIQKIGANARYFTDGASKVPIDVSMGDAACGMAIDFFGRFQAEASRTSDGRERMRFVTPIGGTSVSCDPISLLRGAGGHAPKAQQAQTRQIAIRFIEFVLSEEGQRLWCYEPGTQDASGELIGPTKYALRRLPIRRTFYPSIQPSVQAEHERHSKYSVDNLADPMINPYAVSDQFVYYPRWTSNHFSVLRDIVRSMCMDSGDELKSAWKRFNSYVYDVDHSHPPPAFGFLPTITLTNDKGTQIIPLNWRTAPEIRRNYDTMDYMREWTKAFRDYYNGV